GKLSFIKPGNNTFPKAIATPIKAVPINKVETPVTERNKIPIVKIIIETNIVLSIPYLLASLDAKGDISAKASNGTVVMVPITALETPKLSLITGIKEPTAVSGALRLDAINNTPINSKTPFTALFFCSCFPIDIIIPPLTFLQIFSMLLYIFSLILQPSLGFLL